MLVNQLPKQKKRAKSRYKPVLKEVMKIVEERSGGICEYCHKAKATDPHHICEKGMGGGSRIDSPINILHVCSECHNHDNTEFIHKANEILRQRLEWLFADNQLYTLGEIAYHYKLSREEIERQFWKGFLKAKEGWPSGYEIKQWMGVA